MMRYSSRRVWFGSVFSLSTGRKIRSVSHPNKHPVQFLALSREGERACSLLASIFLQDIIRCFALQATWSCVQKKMDSFI